VSADRVGEQVTALERTFELADMIAYAGATWDWHRLHYDADFLAARRLPAPIVDGQVFGALIAAALQDHFGPGAVVRTLEYRFKNVVFAGERVRVSGDVVHVSAEGTLLEVSMSVDVVGVSARPVTVDARAELLVSA